MATKRLLWDRKTVASALGCSMPTLDRWVRDGLIPSITLCDGKRTRRMFRPATVERFVRERESPNLREALRRFRRLQRLSD